MMHVHFHLDRQREHRRELDRKLELNRLRTEAREARRPLPKPVLLSVVNADAAEVAQLAALNEAPAPSGLQLVASVDGEIVAAQGLENKRVLTDPFRKTAHLTRLLAIHAKGVLADRAA